MSGNFTEALKALVKERMAKGADPKDVFEELTREANQVFDQYNLEYELGLKKR